MIVQLKQPLLLLPAVILQHLIQLTLQPFCLIHGTKRIEPIQITGKLTDSLTKRGLFTHDQDLVILLVLDCFVQLRKPDVFLQKIKQSPADTHDGDHINHQHICIHSIPAFTY